MQFQSPCTMYGLEKHCAYTYSPGPHAVSVCVCVSLECSHAGRLPAENGLAELCVCLTVGDSGTVTLCNHINSTPHSFPLSHTKFYY